MRTQLMHRGVLGPLAWTALLLAGCPGEDPSGVTCGPNTEAVDGECVSTIDEAPCAEGASRNSDTDQCEPDVECGPGTTYNTQTQECDPDSVCGDGTTFNEATGECDPDVVCGAGTTFEPSTGTCLPNIVCGDGTHLDAEARACVPDDNCGTGTTFDPATGTCAPDLSCGPGLTAVDDVCLSALDLIVTEADVLESSTDANDPALGGTPEVISLEGIGERAVFAGNIDRPVDQNGDGVVDQDRDVWRFTATEGQLLRVRVVSSGAFQSAFTVTGPNGYYREPQLGFSVDADRQVILPHDGHYEVTVLPSLVLQGLSEPIGDADAAYAAIIEQLAWPTAVTVTLPATGELAQADGSLLDLSDNFFDLTPSAAAPLLLEALTTSGNTTPVLLLFRDDGSFAQEIPFRADAGLERAFSGAYYDAAAGLVAVLDWRTSNGLDAPFTLSANVIGTMQEVGAVAVDDTVELQNTTVAGSGGAAFLVDLPAGQVVLTDFADFSGSLSLVDPNGDLLFVGTKPSYDAIFYSETAGPYLWIIANDSASDRHTRVAVRTFTPRVGGSFSGDVVADISFSGDMVHSGTRPGGEFILVDNSGPAILKLDLHYAFGLPNLDVYRLGDNGAVASRQWFGEGDAPTLHVHRPEAARNLVRLDPDGHGRLRAPDVRDWRIDVRVMPVPDGEIEPNDTMEAPQDLGAAPATVTGDTTGDAPDLFSISLDTPLQEGEVLQVDLDNITPERGVADKLTLSLNHPGPAIAEDGALHVEGAPGTRFYLLPEDGPGPFILAVEGSKSVEYLLDVRRVSVAHEAEPNDTLAAANAVGPLASADLPFELVGRTEYAFPDVFVVELAEALPERTALRIGLRNVTRSSSLDLVVYDQAQTEILDLKDDDLAVLTSVSGTGPLYIEVVGTDKKYNDMYQLVIDVVPDVESDPLGMAEPQPTTVLPTLIAGAPTVIWGAARKNETDLFEIPIDQALADDELLSVRWSNVNLRGSFTVRILDAAQNPLTSTHRYWGELVARPTGLGPFYVEVTAASSINYAQLYTLEVERIASDATLEAEPNNSIATAQALTLPVTVAGVATDTIPDDVYAVTLDAELAAGEKLIVKGLLYYSDNNLLVRVLDSADVELATALYDSRPHLEVELPIGTAGTTYYVEVTGDPDQNSSTSLLVLEGDSYELFVDIAVP